MTTYLLDTNACIALINGAPAMVRQRFERALAREGLVLLSSIVAFELWYGVGKSRQREKNTQRLEAFLAGPLEWTPFDDEDARAAGAVRARLADRAIGAYDVLLAGQAQRHDATLVTSNVREFERVPGVKCEDWSRSRG